MILKLKMLWLYGFGNIHHWYRDVWVKEPYMRTDTHEKSYIPTAYGCSNHYWWRHLWATRKGHLK